MKSKVIRKVGGILIIDGVKMRSPSTIHCDRPGRLKARGGKGYAKISKQSPKRNYN